MPSDPRIINPITQGAPHATRERGLGTRLREGIVYFDKRRLLRCRTSNMSLTRLLLIAAFDLAGVFFGKISAQPHTFIMHTVLCLLKTMNRTIERLWD